MSIIITNRSTGSTSTLVAPTVQKFLANPGTPTGYIMQISSATFANGNTYQDTGNSNTYTAVNSGSPGTLIYLQGSGAPSGTSLNLLSGSGDAAISPVSATSFQPYGTYTRPTSPTPLYLKVTMVGGGGGAGGAGDINTAGAGQSGKATIFDVMTANGGSGGPVNNSVNTGGAGGSASLGAGPTGLPLTGGSGNAGAYGTYSGDYMTGGVGGVNPLGGSGSAGFITNSTAPAPNTGAGGTGGSTEPGAGGEVGGFGGGAGGYINAFIASPASTYLYSIGVGGAVGASGTGSPHLGTAGADGLIIVEEFYQ